MMSGNEILALWNSFDEVTDDIEVQAIYRCCEQPRFVLIERASDGMTALVDTKARRVIREQELPSMALSFVTWSPVQFVTGTHAAV